MDENCVEGKARSLVGKVQEEIGRAEGDLGTQVKGQLNQAAGLSKICMAKLKMSDVILRRRSIRGFVVRWRFSRTPLRL